MVEGREERRAAGRDHGERRRGKYVDCKCLCLQWVWRRASACERVLWRDYRSQRETVWCKGLAREGGVGLLVELLAEPRDCGAGAAWRLEGGAGAE